jgi:stress-induced morphogen
MAGFDELQGIRTSPHAEAAILVDQFNAWSTLAQTKLVKPALAARITATV